MGEYCQDCGQKMSNPDHRICWNCFNTSKKTPPKIEPYGKKSNNKKNNKEKKEGIDWGDPLTIGAIAFFTGLVIGILL